MIKWQTWCFKLPSASASLGGFVVFFIRLPRFLQLLHGLFLKLLVCFFQLHIQSSSLWNLDLFGAARSLRFRWQTVFRMRGTGVFLGEMERFNMKRSIVLNSCYSINFVKSTCLKIRGPQKNPSNYRFWTGKPIRGRPALRLSMFNPNSRNAFELVDLAMALPHFTAVTLRASLALLKASMAISNASWRWQAGMRASRISDWQHVPYNVELVRTINTHKNYQNYHILSCTPTFFSILCDTI